MVSKLSFSGIVFLPRIGKPKDRTESSGPEHPGGQTGHSDL